MNNTSSKEVSSSINSDAIDAVADDINRVGILDSEVQICANCGKEGSDVTNTCNKCNSVMYCNAACKKKHRSKHKKQCERRVAELHDEKLFKQPPPFDDCPICFIRLPTLVAAQTYMSCCGKLICCGCIYAFQSRITSKKEDLCPFCRTPPPYSDGETIKRYEKRMELNDPQAIRNLGCYYAQGQFGLRQNFAKALKLFHRAGELGFSRAYYNIGYAYRDGNGVERDMKKALHYWELAAMGGSMNARHNVGVEEWRAGNMERALKHYMIAVKDGNAGTLKCIKALYSNGDATKDDYAKALRSYQAYLEEIKSDQRDEAVAFDDRNKYYESAV